MVENNKAVAPPLRRCFWKLASLVDAVEDDDLQVGDILDLRKIAYERFAQNEMDSENEEGTLSDEVHDGI